jgi:type II secretory ATPase GspE/PulE/Tfp pilus assembly ATPase PilB-like protein
LSGLDDDEVGDTPGSNAEVLSAAADNELVRLVNKIIVDAYQKGASDIHIEPRPGKEKTLIRFRRDGSLAPYIEVPASYRSALIARLKIMSDLDISEKRRPQDGKIKFKKLGAVGHRAARGDAADGRRHGGRRATHPRRRRTDPAR